MTGVHKRYAAILLLWAVVLTVCIGYRVWRADAPDATVQQFANDFEEGQYYFNSTNDPNGVYDISKAQAAYERAVLDPELVKQYSALWYQLGRIYFIRGEFDKAIAAFDAQIATYGDAVAAVHYMRGLTYGFKARNTNSQFFWAEAARSFEHYLTLNPESVWAHVDLAWVYFSQGAYEKMGPVLEDQLKVHPDNPWVLNMYGLYVLNHLQNKTVAHTYFERAAVAAETVTLETWGGVYPGNDPQLWGAGVVELRRLIQHNLELSTVSEEKT